MKHSMEAIKTSPSQVATAIGLGVEELAIAATELAAAGRTAETEIALLSLLSGKGFATTAMRKCVQKWGVHAPQIIRANPFQMMFANIPGAGFKRCDRLYLELGGRPEKLKRQALSGWYAVRNCSSGSTWHRDGVFRQGVIEAVGTSRSRFEAAMALSVRGRLLVCKVEADGKAWVADPGQAGNERQLAYHLARLLRASPVMWPDLVLNAVTPHQEAEYGWGRVKPVFLLTGTPGTGKTYLAAQICRAVAYHCGSQAIAVWRSNGEGSGENNRANAAGRAQPRGNNHSPTPRSLTQRPRQEGLGFFTQSGKPACPAIRVR